MAVSASKVKAVCTAAEVELVRASRKPVLQRLTATELSRQVARARKLADKWENQGRKQTRSRSARAGMTDRDANTALKAEIFRDALNAFSAQLAALEAARATGGPQPVRPSKSRRVASHRSSRTSARLAIAHEKRALAAKAPKRAAKKAAATVQAPGVKAGKTADGNAKSAATATASVVKKKPAAKKVAPPKSATAKSRASQAKAGVGLQMSKAKQRKATTAAKKARIAASGKAGRVQGHVLARGRRAQAARDARN
jgi:hypothetical protein